MATSDSHRKAEITFFADSPHYHFNFFSTTPIPATNLCTRHQGGMGVLSLEATVKSWSYWTTDCCCFLVAKSCLTLWDSMNYNPPGFFVYGIIPARLLEWGAISSSRGSSWPRDWSLASSIGRWFFTIKPPGQRLPTPKAGELFFNVPIFLSQGCYQPIDLSLRGCANTTWEYLENRGSPLPTCSMFPLGEDARAFQRGS